jgi:hypothetical protein
MRTSTWVAFLSGSWLAVSGAVASQTAAPPELQQTIIGVFPQSAKCGKSVNPKVLSSKQTPSGEIEELWQASTCDTHAQIRYLFRLAPGKAGALEVVGFERAK